MEEKDEEGKKNDKLVNSNQTAEARKTVL